jgi:hypothetical protein
MPRTSRKKKDNKDKNENKEQTEEQKQADILKKREEARNKLQLFLKEKKLERNSKQARNVMIDRIEDKLEISKNTKERKQLKKDLKLLEKIAEKDDRQASEFPEYGDNASYGGGLEHPE